MIQRAQAFKTGFQIPHWSNRDFYKIKLIILEFERLKANKPLIVGSSSINLCCVILIPRRTSSEEMEHSPLKKSKELQTVQCMTKECLPNILTIP